MESIPEYCKPIAHYALYNNLAKEAGGSGWEATTEDPSLLLVNDKYVVSGWQDSEAIAGYSATKLSTSTSSAEQERSEGGM